MRGLFHWAALALALCILGAQAVPAQGAEKIRVLIVDGQNNHNWRAATPVLKQLLEDSGRFTVSVTSNIKDGDKPGEVKDTVAFPPNLSEYDVLLSNYNGAAWPNDFQKQLEERLKAGTIGSGCTGQSAGWFRTKPSREGEPLPLLSEYNYHQNSDKKLNDLQRNERKVFLP